MPSKKETELSKLLELASQALELLRESIRKPGSVDWSKPVLTFEEVQEVLDGAESTMKDFCRDHPEFARKTKKGSFVIHRDNFVEWLGSGRVDD